MGQLALLHARPPSAWVTQPDVQQVLSRLPERTWVGMDWWKSLGAQGWHIMSLCLFLYCRPPCITSFILTISRQTMVPQSTEEQTETQGGSQVFWVRPHGFPVKKLGFKVKSFFTPKPVANCAPLLENQQSTSSLCRRRCVEGAGTDCIAFACGCPSQGWGLNGCALVSLASVGALQVCAFCPQSPTCVLLENNRTAFALPPADSEMLVLNGSRFKTY